ncbi:MAG TPA: hypothetical protein VID71_08685 [Steroidobacteraceae bacterium]|jgi:hypothetical protein
MAALTAELTRSRIRVMAGLAQLTQSYVTLQKSLGLGWVAGG